MLLFKRFEKGFTLIELMIAMAILAIIAAIALPSYQDSVRKTRRSECQAMLLQVAQAQERHFTEFNQYATAVSTAVSNANTLLVGSLTSENGFCTLGVVGNGTTFSLRAVPAAPSGHTDPECGTLSVDETGQKRHSVPTGTSCW